MTDDFKYRSDNLIVGSAELPAVHTEHGICWALPGQRIECCTEQARKVAECMDQLIARNLKKYRRKLFR